MPFLTSLSLDLPLTATVTDLYHAIHIAEPTSFSPDDFNLFYYNYSSAPLLCDQALHQLRLGNAADIQARRLLSGGGT